MTIGGHLAADDRNCGFHLIAPRGFCGGTVRAIKDDEAKGASLKMLWTIAVILVVLWLLGLVSAYTLGGFIHILLVLAIVMVVIQLIQGRRVI